MSSVEINYNVTVINNYNESEGTDIVKIIEIIAGILCAVMTLFTVYRCTCKRKGRSDIEAGSMNDNENGVDLVSMLVPEEDDRQSSGSMNDNENGVDLVSMLGPEEDDRQSLVPTSHHPEEPPAYKTWVLRVFIHCEGCKRKLFKLLHTIAGVCETVFDEMEHKMTVTGTVSGDTLVQTLLEKGEPAEILPESFKASAKVVDDIDDVKDEETESEDVSIDVENDDDDLPTDALADDNEVKEELKAKNVEP